MIQFLNAMFTHGYYENHLLLVEGNWMIQFGNAIHASTKTTIDFCDPHVGGWKLPSL
jgi:hypothetical protein